MNNMNACSNGFCNNNFDLAAALKGAPVVTRSGKKVKVITKTADSKLLVCVYGRFTYEDRNVKYNIDGSRWSQNTISPDDLMMAA